MKRSHDEIYLKENNKSVKQAFIEVADEIERAPFQTLADVGCATGACPRYLKSRFPNAKIIGVEYLESLLTKAQKDFPDINFYKGNVLNKESISEKFDVITMLGVLAIFDNYKKVLDNVISWLNPKGRLIIHSMVSEHDVDVFIKYKSSSLEYDSDVLESGWNIISSKSLSEVALANNAKVTSSKPFMFNFDLDKQQDVMRSWTELNSNGDRDFFNALHIRQPQRIVTIEKQ
jgi:trans-aconitate methyltransferase